jgi:hypothetical protein
MTIAWYYVQTVRVVLRRDGMSEILLKSQFLNLNPEFDPLENNFNLKYIVWTIVSF